MSAKGGPDIVRNGLVLYLDAANDKSYPGSGTIWEDLSGNGNNGTLTNGPTYNTGSLGNILFDGIDDLCRPNVNHSYLQSSALEVVFKSTNHGSGYRTIFGYRHNSGYSLPTIGSIYLNGNTLSASVITTTQVYRTVTFQLSIQTNQIYHVIFNKDTVSGTLQLFVNGVGSSTQTFDTQTYAQWPSSGSFIGANVLDIAKSTNTNSTQGWAADYFSGNVYKLSVYNRTLSVDEILQNYNATKGRFGL